jgi:hypothetical protein
MLDSPAIARPSVGQHPRSRIETTRLSQPWVWSQHWLDLFFAHWPVPVAKLRPHVPAALDIDTCEGAAWVSLVAFRLERVRRRWLPSLGFVTNTLELNLRTYVRYHGEPAIYFLSIHASNPLVVQLTRWATPLCYNLARLIYARTDGCMLFDSRRPAQPRDLAFSAGFARSSAKRMAQAGSLDEWLVERYCLYAQNRQGTMFRSVIQHVPWTIRDVTPHISINTMGHPFGLDLSPDPAHAHFSAGVHAHIWPFEDVRTGSRHELIANS